MRDNKGHYRVAVYLLQARRRLYADLIKCLFIQWAARQNGGGLWFGVGTSAGTYNIYIYVGTSIFTRDIYENDYAQRSGSKKLRIQ